MPPEGVKSLALWLEHKYSKNQILELYLNRVYFGSGAYGVEAAAQTYYSKHAGQLSLPGKTASNGTLGFAVNLNKDVEDKRRLLTALGMVK